MINCNEIYLDTNRSDTFENLLRLKIVERIN